MASAVANSVGIARDAFLDYCSSSSAAAAAPSCGWLSPRISFSFDFADEEDKPRTSLECPMRNSVSLMDFEFRPDDSMFVLPADELISDGKIVPLDLAPTRTIPDVLDAEVEVGSGPVDLKDKEVEEVVGSLVESAVVSPKAPRCARKWKEILGLKKAVLNQKLEQDQNMKSKCSSSRSLKHFLSRNPKSIPLNDPFSLPLLRDSDSSTDTNLSSHSSLSNISPLTVDKKDSEKVTDTSSQNPPTLRVAKSRNVADPTPPLPDHHAVLVGRSRARPAPETTIPPRVVSVDSPRMNASGKIVFQSLGRSSSSPSSLNGGPRPKNRAMERSYSTSVRISPVLNVPVYSLRGSSKSMFGLFSKQKKESVNRSSGNCKSRSISKNEKP